MTFNDDSQSILCEAYAMVRRLVADLQAAGHEVTIVVSNESQRPVPCDFVDAAGSPRQAFHRQLPKFDAAYVIAPETEGMLTDLVEMTEDECGSEKSLNQPSSAVRRTSDKFQVYETLRRSGLGVARTLALYRTDPAGFNHAFATLGFPLIIKPTGAVACEGLTVAFTEQDLLTSRSNHREGGSTLIAQEYVRGIPASVSLLCSEKGTRPLSLNRQVLLLDRRLGHSMYLGGVVPLDYSGTREAFRAASRAAEVLGLNRGYVGIDVVLTRDGPVIMDVNPRLTTSYVGLKKTASINVAEWMVKTCTTHELPPSVVHGGYAIFLKVDPEYERGYFMVEGYGVTLVKAAADFRRARSTLRLQGDPK